MTNLETLGSIPYAIAAALLLCVAAWCAGKMLMQITNFQAEAASRLDRFLLCIPVGLPLIGLAGFSLSVLGLIPAQSLAWLLVAVCATGILHVARALRKTNWRLPKLRSWQLLAIGPVLVTLGPALCYPTGWDELVYHEVLPRRWLADGWPTLYTDLPYSGFPSLMEILCLMIAPIESVIAPRLLNWTCWLLGCLLFYRLLRRDLSDLAAAVLTAAFAFSPTVLVIGANFYVETLILLNVAAMLYLLPMTPAGNSKHMPTGNAITLGILAGGIGAAKLTGLIFVAIPIAWHTLSLWPNIRLREINQRKLLIYLASFSLICLPFYLRPWLATGNPFFPYFGAWFSRDPATIAMSEYHHTIADQTFGIRSAATFLTTPILLAFDHMLYDGRFGWQFLIVCTLAVIAAWKELRTGAWKDVAMRAGLALGLYCFWFATSQQARFAIPWALAVTWLSALAIRRMNALGMRLAMGLLAITTAVSLPWVNAAYYIGSWETACGMWTWRAYVRDGTGEEYMRLVGAIEDLTPKDAKLLMLLEHRTFYIPRECVVGTPFFQSRLFGSSNEMANDANLITRLRSEGFSFIGLAKQPVGPDKSAKWWERMEPLYDSLGRSAESGAIEILWSSEEYLIIAIE